MTQLNPFGHIVNLVTCGDTNLDGFVIPFQLQLHQSVTWQACGKLVL